jgi:hypothetical protein
MIALDVHNGVGAITNIEYTQFGSLKASHPELFDNRDCPANANILFIDLHSIDEALENNPIPGMIVNAKTPVGATKKFGARLESCMQNIADGLTSAIDAPDGLKTFLLLQERGKAKSELKSAFRLGGSPYTTPASCLYDWNKAMRQLLAQCQVQLPKRQTLEEFLRNGPAVLITIHPAMGPFWDVIAQKVSGGSVAQGSEVELEIAELSCQQLNVDGSFRLIADVVTGQMTQKGLFTDKVGRATLNNLTVRNSGLNSRDMNMILRGNPDRKESCEIRLEGFSEIVAENITIQGDFHLTVPDGQRAILTQGPLGSVETTLEPITKPGWTYIVAWDKGSAPGLKMKRKTYA